MIEPGTHKLTEALEGQSPSGNDAEGQQKGPAEPSGHNSTPEELAEATRVAQESQATGRHGQDRDKHLNEIGRGDQTHG